MVRGPSDGYPGALMSMREVPAPERAGGDDGPADRPDLAEGPIAGDLSDARLGDPLALGRTATALPGLTSVPPRPTVAPRPIPDGASAGPSNGVSSRPSADDLLRPGAARRGADSARGGRSHSAARGRKPVKDGGSRSWKPTAQVKPARGRTIVYEDQTRGGDDAPAIEVRKVRRVLRRIDTWSLFRFAVMLYACAMLVFLVAAVGLWIVASTAGAIPSIEHFITSLFALKKFHFRTGQLFLASLGLGIVWVLAATLFTTVAGVLYNLISDVVGGIELTVLEEEPVDIVD